MSRYIFYFLLFFPVLPGMAQTSPAHTPDILDHPRFLKTAVANENTESPSEGEAETTADNSPEPEFTATFTPTPLKVQAQKKYAKTSPKPPESRLPLVTTIPNPAWGKKMTFRIMAEGFVDVRILIYNRNLDPIDELKKSGTKYFDILWNLSYIPEGPYYYQAQITEKESGKITNFPAQKFVVLKKEEVKQKSQVKPAVKSKALK
jgi:hypothetical protein